MIPWPMVAPIAIVLFTIAAFLPAIMAEYVYWDDDDLLIGNTIYRTLDGDSLHWMFTTSYAGHFQPLTWLSYWLDWTVWKREASGYHLTNVLLHAGTALMFYFLTKRLMIIAQQSSMAQTWMAQAGRPGRSEESLSASQVLRCAHDDAIAPPMILFLTSALAALLFAIHPLRVESAAWLAERRDVLSGFFFVASILSYVRWRVREPGHASTRGWYWLAVFLQLLSLLAKASAVSLPIVLLILDVYPLRRLSATPLLRRLAVLVWDKTPFFILALAAGLRAWAAQAETGAMYPLAEYDFPSRTAQALYGFSFYAWKTLFPLHLGPLYQIPQREVLMGWIFAKGLTGSAILLALAVAYRRRCPLLTAAIGAYAAVLLPVSGLFQSGPQLVADRYSYLSCLGFAVLPAAGLMSLARSSLWRKPNVAGLTTLACAATLGGLFFATTSQSLIWSTALDLWKHAVTVSPDSSIVHTNLADAYLSLPIPNTHEAIEHYRRALELDPRDAIATHHFGDALNAIGDDRGAESLYMQSLRLDPSRTRALLSLSQLWIARGRAYQATLILRDHIRRAPYDLAAMGFLAELLATHPDPDVRDGCEACELASRVSLARGHRDPNAMLILASAQAEDGNFDDAIATAQRGMALADKLGLDSLSLEFRYRMELFKQGIPYHFGD